MYSNELKQGIAFLELLKAQHNPKYVENGDVDPKVKFMEECAKDNVLAIPILRKIQSNSLQLRDIRITDGLAKGLTGNLLMAKEIVQRLYLDNNGLSDGQLSMIIHGLYK